MSEATVHRITDAKSAGYDALAATEHFLQAEYDSCPKEDDTSREALTVAIDGIRRRRRKQSWFRRTNLSADNHAIIEKLPVQERE